ncbi:MAG: XRE family transcriptional regulator [Cohaesibacter sp.]|nr:XRE family transcriptional regulator [Cohaesibacter sp.]
MSFNGQRLSVARQRRGHNKQNLAKMLGVTPRTITGWENNEYPPEPQNVKALLDILDFPADFFAEDQDLPVPEKDAVSFRSMSRMKAAQRDATRSAFSIAQMVNQWLEANYQPPPLDIPTDLREHPPEIAAAALRDHWNLGNRPITNMVHLLEAKGVRVFSLSQACVEVDACSNWTDNQPYILLNTFKSAERSRFDAAHELGHLCLHNNGAPNGRIAESEANTFASHFLMPTAAIRADAPRIVTLKELIKRKKKWKVSVAALAYFYWKTGILSEWNYKSIAIQIQKEGYRTREPEGCEREQSRLWEKLFSSLRAEGKGKAWLANELHLPMSEISELLFGLVTASVETEKTISSPPKRGHLRLVHSNSD